MTKKEIHKKIWYAMTYDPEEQQIKILGFTTKHARELYINRNWQTKTEAVTKLIAQQYDERIRHSKDTETYQEWYNNNINKDSRIYEYIY
jgi:hypothetical protein